MGVCGYCGKSAGIFHHEHSACRDQYRAGWEKIVERALACAQTGGEFDELERELPELARSSLISAGKAKEALAQGWSKAVDTFLEDHALSVEEETRLTTFSNHFHLEPADLNRTGAYVRVGQAHILRYVLAGELPPDPGPIENLPFNLQKGETLVSLSADVKYYEDRVRRQYVGGSRGVSVRVMKGVYYRVGAFKAQPVDTTVTTLVDTGFLGITTKHLYFSGPAKSFRVPYSKIVSFRPYSNGFGITRDSVSAKPQSFVTGDGWFVYNVVTNLAKR
jgi:hypothetical protein